MKRAIAIGFLTWAAFAAIYDFVLRGHMSYALPAAIGAGLFMAVVAGTVRISIDDLLSARRLSIDTEPRDGETVAATGPIRVDGEPLRAPFSRRPAAIYIYEIDRDVRGSSVKDYSGFALAPSTVEAFHGPVRLAGFPRLENFEKTIPADARPDVAGTEFDRAGARPVRRVGAARRAGGDRLRDRPLRARPHRVAADPTGTSRRGDDGAAPEGEAAVHHGNGDCGRRESLRRAAVFSESAGAAGALHIVRRHVSVPRRRSPRRPRRCAADGRERHPGQCPRPRGEAAAGHCRQRGDGGVADRERRRRQRRRRAWADGA